MNGIVVKTKEGKKKLINVTNIDSIDLDAEPTINMVGGTTYVLKNSDDIKHLLPPVPEKKKEPFVEE